jgi:hypothetical protein
MVERNLIARVFEKSSPVTLTFGGLRALREVA